MKALLDELKLRKFTGRKLLIGHCFNLSAAEYLATLVREAYPGVEIEYVELTALCAFYAEEGGLMLGFETE